MSAPIEPGLEPIVVRTAIGGTPVGEIELGDLELQHGDGIGANGHRGMGDGGAAVRRPGRQRDAGGRAAEFGAGPFNPVGRRRAAGQGNRDRAE